jgi:hypothetical protein
VLGKHAAAVTDIGATAHRKPVYTPNPLLIQILVGLWLVYIAFHQSVSIGSWRRAWLCLVKAEAFEHLLNIRKLVEGQKLPFPVSVYP